MTAIEVKGLIKKFGHTKALDSISFSVPENKIFGLLGSNGAGKTTTINILTGLLIQNSGIVKILGMESPKKIEQIRKNIALVPQTISLYESLTVYENLEFFGGMYINDDKKLAKKIVDMMKKFGILSKSSVRISKLSGGYQRRCSIACALISKPKILFLDEPLTGIDIETTEIIMKFIKSLKNMTIIFTTHSIKEAEEVCDNIIFLDRGKKVIEGNPHAIKRKYSRKLGERILIEFKEKKEADKVEHKLKKGGFNISHIVEKGKKITFITKDPGNSIVNVISALKSMREDVVNIDISKPSLEDIFSYIRGGGR